MIFRNAPGAAATPEAALTRGASGRPTAHTARHASLSPRGGTETLLEKRGSDQRGYKFHSVGSQVALKNLSPSLRHAIFTVLNRGTKRFNYGDAVHGDARASAPLPRPPRAPPGEGGTGQPPAPLRSRSPRGSPAGGRGTLPEASSLRTASGPTGSSVCPRLPPAGGSSARAPGAPWALRAGSVAPGGQLLPAGPTPPPS